MACPLFSIRFKRFLGGVGYKALWLRFLLDRLMSGGECHRFRCNICGNVWISPVSAIRNREARSCCSCGSTRRFRTIVAVLSKELFGAVRALPDLKEARHLTGIGLSDSDIYARRLSRIFSYKNTYYHAVPRLDITCVGEEMHNSKDFIIASDVFEHIAPPIDRAFENLFKILKKGGICVFSVPYVDQGQTREHFPELFEYRLVKKKGKRFLINRTRQGKEQVFENLRFHGGPGTTLEMREFSRSSLMNHISKAGFSDIKVHDESMPEFGILVEKDAGSHIISMRKPDIH